MQTRTRFVYLAGLWFAAIGTAAANCGLDVDPAAMDTNHNAAISRAEAYGSPLAPVFDRIDTNSDGFISQPEYANRCYSLQTSANKTGTSGWNDSMVSKRVQQQQQRQQNRIDDRINRESNEAADSMVDKAMGAIFGD